MAKVKKVEKSVLEHRTMPERFPDAPKATIEAWEKVFPEPFEESAEKAVQEGWAWGKNSVRLGGRLLTLRTKFPHGEWERWVEEEFPLGITTAKDLMQVAAAFGERPELAGRIGRTKAIALLRGGFSASSYDEETDAFVEGNTSISVDEIRAKSAPEVRKFCRKLKKENAAMKEDIADAEKQIAKLKRAVHPVPDDFEEANKTFAEMRMLTMDAIGMGQKYAESKKTDPVILRSLLEATASIAIEAVAAMQYYLTKSPAHFDIESMGNPDFKAAFEWLVGVGAAPEDMGFRGREAQDLRENSIHFGKLKKNK